MEQTALMPHVTAAGPPPNAGAGGAEFTVNKSDLLKELSGLQRIVSRKSTVPILVNIHVQATGNLLALTASDLDLSLRTVCAARVKKEGCFTVSAHKLYEYTRLLNDGEVHIRVQDNGWVQIKCGRSHTRMVGMSPENFPKLPLFPAASAIKLDARMFQNFIQRTLFAVCVEESRHVFNGALLVLKPEGMIMVSTDGHRMAYVESPTTVSIKETRLLIPKKALTEVSSLLGSSSVEHIQFAQDSTTLYFAIGSRLLTSRQIAGKFPNYEAAMPQSYPHKTVLSRQELLLALQRVAQFADERSNSVRIRIANNEFRLSSSNSEIGEAEDILPATYTGEAVTVGFNSQYLLDFLRAVASDTVQLEFKDCHSAGELRPVETTEARCSYRYIVMPLRA
jgi:DNA polymerase III subunit beta